MGTRTAEQRPMAWQGTLAQMQTHGTRVALACTKTPDCRRWEHLRVHELMEKHGADFMLWDRRPECPGCGGPAHYMASPGPSTPYRPLLSGLIADQVKREFLRSFGFTRRDVKRIQLMAETCDGPHSPPALNDLDVPYRVGACMPGLESRSTGQMLGEWKGRTLLWWPMNEREEEVWRRKRRSGPKPVPSPKGRS